MPSIEDAAEKLSGYHRRLDELEEKFSRISSIEKDATVKESFLGKEVERQKVDEAGGVDGGISRRRYSGGDIVAVRVVGAILEFGKNVNARYLPSRRPEPDYHVLESGDAENLEKRSESLRLEKEISVVHDLVSETRNIFLDGSLVPSYLEDDDVLESYEKAFEKVSNGQLAGVVEDSHGLRLSSLMENKLGVEIGNIRDTHLMDVVLSEGERSFVRHYSDSPVEHPVLQALDDRLANSIYTFYVKITGKDLPLRIDYFGTPGDADSLAGKLMDLKTSERYTVPSPVVEADKRAKIPGKYMERFEKRFNPDVERRNRRTF